MAFNCENSHQTILCGKYVKKYLGNLEYVSNGILGIINEHILPNEIVNAPYDITDDKCVCLPICNDTETPTCLTTDSSKVFDCVLWQEIKNHLIVVSNEPDDTQGYLVVLCHTLRCILKNTPNINHGFAAQVERLLCLCESLETRLDSICCNNKCPEIIGDLLCLLIQILTKLVSTISKVSVLVYYSQCDINPTTGNRVIASFFDCMVCDFVNDLCELEKLIPELSAIVIAFATCNMQSCTPCYTASSTPKRVRPICPTNMTGSNNYHGQNCGGCGCKKR